MENIIKQTVDILQEKIDFKQEYGLERLDESKHYQNRSWYKEEYTEYGKHYNAIKVEVTAQVRKRFYIQGIL